MVLTDFGYYILLCLIWVGFFAIIWAIAGFFIFRFIDGKLRACPKCKRRASGKIEHTEIEPLGTQTEHTGKGPVEIKSEKVTDHYVCKNCNHTWIRTFERKERIPLEKKN